MLCWPICNSQFCGGSQASQWLIWLAVWMKVGGGDWELGVFWPGLNKVIIKVTQIIEGKV